MRTPNSAPVSDADVRRCESCDLLILDDLGTEMTTAFVQSALYQIVNGRMLSGRSTIISTNLAPEELGRRYGAPILSRIEGAYQIMPSRQGRVHFFISRRSSPAFDRPPAVQ